MSKQLELPFVDPPQLDIEVLGGIVDILLIELDKCTEFVTNSEEGNIDVYAAITELNNAIKCLNLMEYKLPEINRIIARRYELEQMLEGGKL